MEWWQGEGYMCRHPELVVEPWAAPLQQRGVKYLAPGPFHGGCWGTAVCVTFPAQTLPAGICIQNSSVVAKLLCSLCNTQLDWKGWLLYRPYFLQSSWMFPPSDKKYAAWSETLDNLLIKADILKMLLIQKNKIIYHIYIYIDMTCIDDGMYEAFCLHCFWSCIWLCIRLLNR